MSEQESPKKQKQYFKEKHNEREQQVVEFTKLALAAQKKERNYNVVETPRLALQRLREFNFLRDVFAHECQKIHIRRISNALERWTLTEKLLESGGDPLLPAPDGSINSALFHELRKSFATEAESINICKKLMVESRKGSEILMKFSNRDFDPIRIQKQKHRVNISCLDVQYWINIEHFQKLEKIYSEIQPEEMTHFPTRLFCLLVRYNTLGAPGYQGGLPKRLFDYLKSDMGVEHECFASPLNFTLGSYNSGFYDVDRYFGSKGSFFSFDIVEGSYEANPPFIEEHMLMMTERILEILNGSEKPLSFFIVLPAWEDALYFEMLSHSPHFQALLKFDSGKHYYKDGAQHVVEVQNRVAVSPSFVFILQNVAGKEKWKFDEKMIIERFNSV